MTRTDTPALPAAPTSLRKTRGSRVVNAADALLTAQAETRRGLKAGTASLARAKCAYGEAQWSGEHDRRPEPGLLVRTRL